MILGGQQAASGGVDHRVDVLVRIITISTGPHGDGNGDTQAHVGGGDAPQDLARGFAGRLVEHELCGSVEDALETVERARELDPDNPQMLFTLARILEQDSGSAKAREEVLERFANDAQAVAAEVRHGKREI